MNPMLKFLTALVLCAACFTVSAQQDSATVYPDFHFTDGIYISFDDFKNNLPAWRTFELTHRNGATYLYRPCADSSTAKNDCIVDNPWGYCLNGNVFINQGYDNHYFRLQVVGALIHYYIMEIVYSGSGLSDPFNPYGGMPSARMSDREVILEWSTGKRFDFNYRNFSSFLKNNDPELHQQLESSKKKRKMIYFYLLKYNERHPVYINNQ